MFHNSSLYKFTKKCFLLFYSEEKRDQGRKKEKWEKGLGGKRCRLRPKEPRIGPLRSKTFFHFWTIPWTGRSLLHHFPKEILLQKALKIGERFEEKLFLMIYFSASSLTLHASIFNSKFFKTLLLLLCKVVDVPVPWK